MLVTGEPARRRLAPTLLLREWQEDDADVLHLTAAVLLFDGRANEAAFEMMQAESAFPRLIELVRSKRDDDVALHRLLLELLFEMSRIQKLSSVELSECTARPSLERHTDCSRSDCGRLLHSLSFPAHRRALR